MTAHRSLGNAHDPGDLRDGEISIVVENCGDPLSGREFGKKAHEFRPRFPVRRGCANWGCIDQPLEKTRCAGHRASIVLAAVDAHLEEPGIWTARLHDIIPVSIELHEGILRRVGGKFRVKGHGGEAANQPLRLSVHHSFKALRTCDIGKSACHGAAILIRFTPQGRKHPFRQDRLPT